MGKIQIWDKHSGSATMAWDCDGPALVGQIAGNPALVLAARPADERGVEYQTWNMKQRIREYIGSVIGGRVSATQGSSGPCVYCRKPGMRQGCGSAFILYGSGSAILV
jgi:hypothetical protein